MSALFGQQGFEERLALAFRGSAKEQREAGKSSARKERAEARGFDVTNFPLGPALLTGQTLGGTPSNIFKKNLGGTGGRRT